MNTRRRSQLALLACAIVPVYAFATVSVTQGTQANSYVVIGQIATPDQLIDGKVVVSGDTITCVATDCAEPPGATTIRVTNAYITPGFVDAHNHVAYNVFPKWQPPKLYGNRYQWQDSTAYKTFKAPYNTLKAQVYCEMVKYGEVKALIGGITTIQGTSPNNTCFRVLVRNAENQNELGLPANTIRTLVLPISGFDDTIDWNRTKAFVVHLAEGIDERSRAEFDTLKQKHLLNANTTIIHGTAFGAAEFQQMSAVGAKLVWSPQSNLALYGKTTDIKAAMAAGVKFAIGVDWNPTGSDSLFDELRVAETVNQEEFDGAIPESEWLKLVTSDAADVLALTDKVGRLALGLKADLIVLQRRDPDINQSVLKNLVQDVQLVMVGGRPLYGSSGAMLKLRPTGCEAIKIHGSAKRICVKSEGAGVSKADQTLAELQQILSSRYNSLAPLAP